MSDLDDISENEELAMFGEYLDEQYKKEATTLMASFAVNHQLKEKGIMNQALDIVAASELQPVALGNVNSLLAGGVSTMQDPSAIAPYSAEGNLKEAALFDGITPEVTSAYNSAKEALGGDNVVIDSLADAVAATQTPRKPLTKKQAKQQKLMAKQMRGYLKNAQRQAQTQHIMNRLYAHSIRTPQQARQIHAAQRAKDELTAKLGQRQADAFFAAKPETKCHSFFPKATVEANPTLMTDAQGESRTLTQVYEYYIYKHYMLLTKEAEEVLPSAEDLNLAVDWTTTEVKEFTPYDLTEELAQGDVVEEEQAKAA